jgi:BlaI family transcriptional regulator, penicillinase repressor
MTPRTRSRAAVRAALTPLEHEVMQVVWDQGAAAVDAVHEVVAAKRDLKETTVRTILRRLEHKGFLRHHESGRAYIYRAVEPARRLAARAVRDIIDRLCRGSVEELVTGMVDADVLSHEELKALETAIRDRRRTTAASGSKKGK